jgi:hypothetical protein
VNTRLVRALAVTLPALVLASCAGSVPSVTGRVTFQGKPVEGAVVTFHPKGRDDAKTERPSGVTDKDGNFTLSTGSKAGAPPGEYVVTVNWYKPADAPAGKKPMGTDTQADTPDHFRGKPFADHTTSKLTATVGPGTNALEPFVLD